MKKPWKMLSTTAVFATAFGVSVSAVNAAEDEKAQYLIGFDDITMATEFVDEHEVSEDQLVATSSGEDIDIDVLHEFEHIPVLSAELEKEDVTELKENDAIAYIEEDIEVTISQTIPWGIDRVNAPAANASGVTGSGVSVAVLDTGISTHEDLNIQGGESFVPGEPGIDDGNGHGTHVAGTIAALDNDTGVVGVSPDADLYAVKVLGSDGSGNISSIAQGLQWAGENGMDVANMSLGSPLPSPTLEQAVDEATDRGVLVVAASGNSGASSLSYPAAYDNAMAVGATTQSDARASFSQYGAGLDLVAPGVGVESTYPGGGYRSLDGTSMATPHVAGVAALVLEQNPSWSPQQVRSHINDTATDLGDTNQFGSGLVDAESATD
ncbi:S8 family peptidase [Geomicrobium sediminis]|uniref:Subtilisin n=1 Tax=Geomicrobium sediminis TaxID=1347788 RepID=A0ABS2PBP7_9BACL|nr:S8 family peptidase [Geomicrobium sediminis]MBM7632828.1 subtilisin [Geomicrobium sediminis]